MKFNIESPSLSKTSALVDSYHESLHIFDKPRPYLGISGLGYPCKRYTWLIFRWFDFPTHEGRMYRLFRRGQNEETTVVEDLRGAGLELIHVLDDQMDIDLGCHLKGHPDGVIISGVPEAPKTIHIWEGKTSNDANFKKLKIDGVKVAKFQHYVQMQLYMLGAKIDRTLYTCTNKNDDEMYTERVYFCKEFALEQKEIGQALALRDTPPPKISENKGWYLCKNYNCMFYGFCHENKACDKVNCRTCAHSTPLKDSTWKCEIYDSIIPYEAQLKGCNCHVMNPYFVPSWILNKEKSSHYSAHYFIPELDRNVLNGYEGFSTADLLNKIEESKWN